MKVIDLRNVSMNVGLFGRKASTGLYLCRGLAAALLVSAGFCLTHDVMAENEADAAPFVTRLETSSRVLADLRETIASEKIPLAKSISAAEAELAAARRKNEEARRTLDKLALDVSTLRANVSAREQEKTYMQSLLGEYIRNFETRLHIAEVDRYASGVEEARLAQQNDTWTDSVRFVKQLKVLSNSIARIEELLGGVIFDGRAAGPDGMVKQGQFAFLGPLAYFSAEDGTLAGVAEQRLGSVEPSVVKFRDPAMESLTAHLVANGFGDTPMDGSLGNAHKIEQTQESILEHLRKGGAVMVPIVALAILVTLVIVFKFIQLSLVVIPGTRTLDLLYQAIRSGNQNRAQTLVAGMRGVAATMLTAGVAHLEDSRDLIEESMFEKMLTIRFRLSRFTPLIAVGASCAPLLGLLGTVTGIINTFRMLTIFGSGDVKALSGGISEALITTETGLVIAIPALICHAFLSRKVKGLMDKLEHIAISVMSEVERSRSGKEKESNEHSTF